MLCRGMDEYTKDKRDDAKTQEDQFINQIIKHIKGNDSGGEEKKLVHFEVEKEGKSVVFMAINHQNLVLRKSKNKAKDEAKEMSNQV